MDCCVRERDSNMDCCVRASERAIRAVVCVRVRATWTVVCGRASERSTLDCCVRASERAVWAVVCVRVRGQHGLLCVGVRVRDITKMHMFSMLSIIFPCFCLGSLSVRRLPRRLCLHLHPFALPTPAF